MPSKIQPRTVRFTPEEIETLDALAEALAPPGGKPLDRSYVLRVAIAQLAAERLPTGQQKKSQKKA